jgi:hypothetical protein
MSRVSHCRVACDEVQGETGAQVEVLVGCETIVK